MKTTEVPVTVVITAADGVARPPLVCTLDVTLLQDKAGVAVAWVDPLVPDEAMLAWLQAHLEDVT